MRRQELYRALAQAVGGSADQRRAGAGRSDGDCDIRARVLLAEDNGVNQVVARNMLESLGCEFEIVRNGQEACWRVQRGGYDIVLMDCQMPVMDGYAATREIRAWERERRSRSRVPIIALTANALVGDAEACLAAGMDDYLAKPYTRKQLAGVLARWLPAQLAEGEARGGCGSGARRAIAPDATLDRRALAEHPGARTTTEVRPCSKR